MNTSAPVKISDYISGALAVLSITPKWPQLFEDSKNGFEIKIQKENQQPNNVENGISSAVRIAQKIQEHNQKSSIIKGKNMFNVFVILLWIINILNFLHLCLFYILFIDIIFLYRKAFWFEK